MASTLRNINSRLSLAVDRELGGKSIKKKTDLLIFDIFAETLRGAEGPRGRGIFLIFMIFLEISGICEKIAQLAGSRKSAFLKVRIRNFWDFGKKSPSLLGRENQRFKKKRLISKKWI